MIATYKGDLEVALTEQIGVPVKIGAIEGGWRWLDPVLTVSDIGLLINHASNDTAEVVHLDRFYLHLSVIDSLLKWKLQFQAVEASGLKFPLHQDDSGEWRVPGIANKQNSNALESDYLAMLSIFEQPSLLISDIQVNLSTANQSRTSWNIPSAVMSYDGKAFSASGEVLHPESDEPFVRFSAKGAGWIFSNEFTGKLYLDWVSGPFVNEYLEAYQWQDIRLEDVDASGRLWLEILKGEILSLQGELDIATLQWNNNTETVSPLQNIKADIFWSRLGSSSILSIYDLSLEWLDYRWAPSNYTAYLSDDSINISGQEANLSLLTELLLATKILPLSAHEALEGYRPSGRLTNINLMIPQKPSIQETTAGGSTGQTLPDNAISEKEPEVSAESMTQNDHQPLFELQANLEAVSAKAVGGAPSVSGVTGYLSMTDDQGSVMVDSDNFEMAFPNLFNEGWSFEKSQVIVNWGLSDKGLTVYSDGINLYLSEKSLVFGEFSLNISDNEEDILSLKVGLEQVDAPLAYQFVPNHLVGLGLFEWLKSSIKGGLVDSGLYVGYGSIESDAPPHSFTSSMVFNTRDTRLLYDSAWPELEGINSKIYLQNGDLDISATSATIRGMPLGPIQVKLDGKEEESWLHVSTNVRPNRTDVNYWLNDSPVSEYSKKISEQLSLQGGLDVAISLGIPLHNIDLGVEYDLAIGLNDVTVKHKPTNMLFQQCNGELSLSSQTGITGDKIKLTAFDQQSTLDIKSLLTGDELETTLTLNGAIEMKELNEQLFPGQTLPLTGKTLYTAALTLSSDSTKDTLLSVNSRLKGIEIAVPAPLSKEASKEEPFNLNIRINDDTVAMDAGLGRLVNYKGEFTEKGFKQGFLAIGGVKPELPGEAGLFIEGRLTQLNIESWIDYLATYEPTGDDTSLVRQIGLMIDTVDFYGQHFLDTNIQIQPIDNQWTIQLSGPDVVGQIYLAAGERGLNVELEKVRLLSAGTDTIDDVKSTLSPLSIPEMSISVENMVLDEVNYGQWTTKLVHQDNGIVAKDVIGRLADGLLEGRLSWVQDSYGANTTILTANVTGGNLASVYRALGKPQVLTSKQYSSELALVWSGIPTEFQLAELSGRISIMLAEGTMMEAKSATEAFKVFGILNAEAITRRLKLDFSDLYQKGLGYDRVEGTARMDKGQLYLEKPLAMQGPSSAYKFTGTANLKDETLDMDMVVVLPLTKNLPLAALFLGAPQVGGAVWVIDKLLGEPLSKLTSATYEIKGHWDNPQLKLKNVFDRSTSGAGASNRRRKEQ